MKNEHDTYEQFRMETYPTKAEKDAMSEPENDREISDKESLFKLWMTGYDIAGDTPEEQLESVCALMIDVMSCHESRVIDLQGQLAQSRATNTRRGLHIHMRPIFSGSAIRIQWTLTAGTQSMTGDNGSISEALAIITYICNSNEGIVGYMMENESE